MYKAGCTQTHTRLDILLKKALLGQQSIDLGLKLCLRHGANYLVDGLSVLEKHQRRDAHDTIFTSHIRILVSVQLEDLDLALVFLPNLFYNGRDHPARAAPYRPKINQYETRRFQYFLVPRCARNCVSHLNLLQTLVFMNFEQLQEAPVL